MRTKDLLRAIQVSRIRRSADYAHSYRQLLAQAKEQFPGDGIAQHRAVEAAASRALRVAAESVSISGDVETRMNEALAEAFPGRNFSWVENQVGSYVIARGPDDKLYAIPHTIGEGGGVSWGEPEEFWGQLDSPDSLLGAFGKGTGAARPLEAQPPHVIARGRDGNLYQIGHSVENGVLSWGEPEPFNGQLASVQRAS